ncbi:7280_t:CDS:2 [Funneliformis geosporum]|nr:7280_t:CDS:2 [Funneliformis geosporum]
MKHQYKRKFNIDQIPQNNFTPTRHGVIKELSPNLKYIVETEGKRREIHQDQIIGLSPPA